MFPRPHHTTASGAGSAAFGGNNYGSVITQVNTLGGTSLHLAKQDVTALLVEDFTGRSWLFEELAAFRAACPSGYFIVEAAAGLGKTSFATADPGPPTGDNVLPGIDYYVGRRRTEVAAALIPHVPIPLRQQLWTEVHAARIPDGMPGFHRLTILAEHAEDPLDRDRLIRAAMSHARSVPDIRVLAAALQEVMRILRATAD